ncbi:hypothetical protein CBR_g56393 [Chara braunii]|uniref:Reverse transcriptase n=1 Tax=Chara braunii TaxID=69332 RepID=A0A388MDN0_CHABU|nr:hypothetical protein CBR_g56393 [Chara braunii]|eukprot:GBG92605.1 hypothetical protein CBR_g56393 [Chara braunii]
MIRYERGNPYGTLDRVLTRGERYEVTLPRVRGEGEVTTEFFEIYEQETMVWFSVASEGNSCTRKAEIFLSPDARLIFATELAEGKNPLVIAEKTLERVQRLRRVGTGNTVIDKVEYRGRTEVPRAAHGRTWTIPTWAYQLLYADDEIVRSVRLRGQVIEKFPLGEEGGHELYTQCWESREDTDFEWWARVGEFIKPLFSGQAGDVDRDLIRRYAQEGVGGISDLEIANLALAASEEKKLRDSWWTVTSEESEGESVDEDSSEENGGSEVEKNSEGNEDNSEENEPGTGGIKKHKTVAEKVKPAAVSRDRTGEATISKEEIADIIRKRKETEGQRITADRLAKIDIGDGNLTEEEKGFIAMTLRGCDKAIAFDDSERGRIDPRYAKPARIHTVPHVPWKERPQWKYAQKEKEEIVAFIKEKIRTFVAEPCESAYSNKWFFLRKGGSNKLRWIQNLQRTNAVTIRDVGSIPEADLLAEGSAGRSIFSICELFSGYDEISLDYRDRHMTAMHTPLGLVQMMVVPMGWTNGVAVFQRAMIAVLKEFIPDKVEVFLDDFPIKGPVERDETEVFPGVRKFVADHMSDVRNVLEKLDDANLTVSGTKSRWGVSSIKILGFICDKEGRRPDPEKLVKLMTWPSPLKSITEVRQFLGVVGYWRIFIKAYGDRAEPLRRLLRKSEGWVWGEEQAAAMEVLKEEFREGGEVLGVSFFEDEESRPFIVSTDAGPHSVGGLLSQKDGEGKERPLRFESRTLNPAERNYSQFKKEVLGVLHCLKAFRHYLYGRQFLLRVDPTAVAAVLQKDFSLTDPTIARWMIHIRLYDYSVERISGTKNQVADDLSQLPIREEDLPRLKDEEVTMAKEEIMKVVTNRAQIAGSDRGEEGGPRTFLANLYDGKYRDIGLYLAGREIGTERIQQEALGYCLRGGHLFKRPTKFAIPMRVLCDPEERRAVIEELHDGIVGGHRGVKGTFDKVRRLYWWDGQYTEVEKYCSTCEACQKRATVRYKEPLVPSLPTVPGEKVHVDLVTMSRGVGGLRYARDDLTGFVEAKAIKKKTTEEVSDFLLEYIARYGCVGRIVMGRGAEFLSQTVKGLLEKAGIGAAYTTAYHPQSNAPVERGHQTLVDALAKWCKGRRKQWPRYLRNLLRAKLGTNASQRAAQGGHTYTRPLKAGYGRRADGHVSQHTRALKTGYGGRADGHVSQPARRKRRRRNRSNRTAGGQLKLEKIPICRPGCGTSFFIDVDDNEVERGSFALQAMAFVDVERDLTEKTTPMDRLVCGDVGFGKTEVALRAILLVISNKKQVMVLAPTTVLVKQHYTVIKRRFRKFPSVSIAMLSRLQKDREKREIIGRIKDGTVDIVVGTHALLGNAVNYRNVGLLVVDEEQRFGVKQKEKISAMKTNVDVLMLSATPIPRTLYMALSGFRDTSLINTPPPERRPIQTHLMVYRQEDARKAVQAELDRGGQIYYVVPRIAGEGFKLAERDMVIRGIGTVFGEKQSGEASRLGMDLYLEMLYEGLEKVGHQSLPKVEYDAVQLDIDFRPEIPEEYVPSEKERERIVKEGERVAATGMKSLIMFTETLRTTFGREPTSVEIWLKTLYVKRAAADLGISRIASEGRTITLETAMAMPAFNMLVSSIETRSLKKSLTFTDGRMEREPQSASRRRSNNTWIPGRFAIMPSAFFGHPTAEQFAAIREEEEEEESTNSDEDEDAQEEGGDVDEELDEEDKTPEEGSYSEHSEGEQSEEEEEDEEGEEEHEEEPAGSDWEAVPEEALRTGTEAEDPKAARKREEIVVGKELELASAASLQIHDDPN